MSRRAPARSAGLCPAAFSRFRAFRLCFQLRPSFFSKASPCFSLVYTIGAPRGWEGTRKFFFFAYKAHHPIVGPFRSCSLHGRQIRAPTPKPVFFRHCDLSIFLGGSFSRSERVEARACTRRFFALDVFVFVFSPAFSNSTMPRVPLGRRRARRGSLCAQCSTLDGVDS